MSFMNSSGIIVFILVWGIGFFLVAAAISYGINRSKLVQKLDDLQNEVRQLRSEIQQSKQQNHSD
ncbi:hypothetical protein [Paenibacillus apiarius]|uniref:hypothetical protein n=1 Tax=Paenibacillus apiarius TaxID=46240 RepID=UPI00197E2F44|nr:hypothetical protein [Paenibacillus apiarius]MBN3526735.1 hypothetical protein [Paenibacillus apiarius]